MLALSLFLMGADNGEQNADERGKLLEQQKQLSARIKTLTQERDFLLFQRTMYSSDSKYLILNISKKTGQLKYKNRVLKDFHVKPESGHLSSLDRGALTLTKKVERKRGGNLLLFGTSLVLQNKSAPKSALGAGIPHLVLLKKDFQSIYYAVEPGAKAYILP